MYDAVHDPDFQSGRTQVGKRVMMPATYPGSPRAMQQNYLDAMAMVRVLGKPDYFITMTATADGERKNVSITHEAENVYE